MPTTKCFFVILFLLYATGLFAQTRTLTGKVRSSKDNSGLSGVTVSIKGTNQGVTTSTDGSFSINAPRNRVVLEVSSVGFQNMEVVVEPGNDNITVDLSENTRE